MHWAHKNKAHQKSCGGVKSPNRGVLRGSRRAAAGPCPHEQRCLLHLWLLISRQGDQPVVKGQLKHHTSLIQSELMFQSSFCRRVSFSQRCTHSSGSHFPPHSLVIVPLANELVAIACISAAHLNAVHAVGVAT